MIRNCFFRIQSRYTVFAWEPSVSKFVGAFAILAVRSEDPLVEVNIYLPSNFTFEQVTLSIMLLG